MTDLEFVAMENSTTVRSQRHSRLLPLIRTGTRALSILAPALAGRLAERWFLTPPRPRRPAAEIALLGTAQARPIYVGARRIETWRWGVGPSVLLVHGWGGRGSQLGSFVGPLVRQGFSVVTFDAPGHGASSAGIVTVPEIIGAIRAVAGSREPLAGLIAHSLGATAAVRALYEGLASGAVVLIAPPADLAGPAVWFTEALGFSRAARDGMHRRIEARVGLPWSAFDVATLAPALTAPLLVVHDRDDAEVPWQDGTVITRAWPGAEILMTGGLGHRRILRDPDVVATGVAFLTARAAERGLAVTADEDPRAAPIEILMAR
ncbi:MAG TPA: alpha/beta fold hydrolase [Candidatus Limnocylindrales bacterium]|nr:alpha/beta fold hydrolase [Candidatus Limnocylindrales bacterium]